MPPAVIGLLRRSPWAKALAVLVPVLLVAVVLVVTRPDGGTSDALTQEPASVPFEDSPTDAPSPTASASARPSPTATRSAEAGTTGGTSGSVDDNGGLGPKPPGSVTVAHTSGQSSWSGTSNGISIHASISPENPKAGSPVTFTVRVSGPEKDCCAVYMVFGDGGVTGSVECDLPTTGGSETVTYTHVYNKAGPHHMLIQGIANRCNDNGELYGTIDIGDGTSTSQGPSLPVVQFDDSAPPASNPNNRTVALWGQAHDEDGHIAKMVVTFGDGTSHTFAGDPMSCTRTRDGWPGPSEATLPYDPHPYWHTYDGPGTYTLRLTAYSTGCDGTDVQKASATFTWHVGPDPTAAPSPSPSPSPSAKPSPTSTGTP